MFNGGDPLDWQNSTNWKKTAIELITGAHYSPLSSWRSANQVYKRNIILIKPSKFWCNTCIHVQAFQIWQYCTPPPTNTYNFLNTYQSLTNCNTNMNSFFYHTNESSRTSMPNNAKTIATNNHWIIMIIVYGNLMILIITYSDITTPVITTPNTWDIVI